MHLTIITGASRGLGLAMAAQRLAAGHRVLALSRRTPPLQVPPGADLLAWPADLADAAPVAARLGRWLAAQDVAALTSATLINNAGVVSRLAPLSAAMSADQAAAGPGELQNAIRVGLEAPLLLTAVFLHATQGWALPRKVLLVSSGLGRRAMAGSSSYCAAKAGLDHLARAVALEEAARPGGARIVSLAPGVIDTDMQTHLRAADPALFPEHGVFMALKSSGRLDTPAQAAARVLKFLDRADFGSPPVADVRDA